jgi:hypothetical protein
MRRRQRGLACFLVVCALLVFANACQAEADADHHFRAGAYHDAELDSVLAARQADLITHERLEFGSLLAAGLGSVAMLSRRI